MVWPLHGADLNTQLEVRLKNGAYTHYTLGLALGDLSGIPALTHGGEVSGFISSNAVSPTRRAAVVVLPMKTASIW